MQVQWWLSQLDQYGNVACLLDGAHSTRDAVNRAFYLHQRLGYIKSQFKYAAVKCEVHDVTPDPAGVNEEALDTISAARKE